MGPDKLTTLRNAHKKQISITSSIERVVEVEENKRSKKPAELSITIAARPSEPFQWSPTPSDSPMDPMVSSRADL